MEGADSNSVEVFQSKVMKLLPWKKSCPPFISLHMRWKQLISRIWASGWLWPRVFFFLKRPLGFMISFRAFHANSAPRLHFPLIKNRPSNTTSARQTSSVITFLDWNNTAVCRLSTSSPLPTSAASCTPASQAGPNRPIRMTVGGKEKVSVVIHAYIHTHYITMVWEVGLPGVAHIKVSPLIILVTAQHSECKRGVRLMFLCVEIITIRREVASPEMGLMITLRPDLSYSLV